LLAAPGIRQVAQLAGTTARMPLATKLRRKLHIWMMAQEQIMELNLVIETIPAKGLQPLNPSTRISEGTSVVYI
jgi:hypothetical protein